MNIREVAKKAKVSTATVSRTINHVSTVDPQLAKRVWKVVEQFGFHPNVQARALVSGRSRIVGLVVSEITNPFFPEIVRAFEEIAVDHNYEILLGSTGSDSKRTELAVRRMIERRVDGVAVLTFGMEEDLMAHLRYRKVPLVFVDVGPPVNGVSNINIDYQTGIRQGVQHLAGLGHRRIAFISGPLRLKSAQARKKAFETAIREKQLRIPKGFVIEGDHTLEGGMRCLARLAALKSRPTAVMCSNDMTAIGVLREAYELGISIPDQLSVVGFDDIHLAQFVTPPLTTIQMSQTALARLAFDALMDALKVECPSETSRNYVLTTSLVLRKSTALAAQVRESGICQSLF
ncbi:MAG TPA: LacI family DNA-binding transcriptional regulator [Terriglobales bacterium]|nr:LacI family DNA-binding transcriptional regulator [Terriglobales bacterium]